MTEIDFSVIIAKELQLKVFQVTNTIELLDTGNTVPFIARYRKEATGTLDEEQIRLIGERVKYLRMLEERKQTILNSIAQQGKLTPDLKSKIIASLKLQEVEDLYLPYKPKKRTRATLAKERGLEPLADMMLRQDIVTGSKIEIAKKFVDSNKEIGSPEEALAGARDIVAEVISDDAEVRKIVRDETRQKGMFCSTAKKLQEKSEFEIYYQFKEAVHRMVAHRVLAINRGEKEGVLRVWIEILEFSILDKIKQRYIKNSHSIFVSEVEAAIEDAYKRLIAPSIEREIRGELTETAELHAIKVFATNLRKLILQPPIHDKIIMGIDPGYRTGCKVAVIDKTGCYLEGSTIYPHPPQNQVFESKTILRSLVEKYRVDIIAIGNGTASRETETLVAELISDIKQSSERNIYYIIVDEAGASVYSASKIAKQEFPDLDASMRGNISIARRLLDPLAELVKIEPKSIGVGLYQHDVNQKKLTEALDQTVESAVNLVGVDVNTASVSLLKYVSGLTSRSAENLVDFRNKNGPFQDRGELKGVSGIGEIVFQQSAGFLRIPDGKNPLDNTSIHPESYPATRKLLKEYQILENPTDWRKLNSQVRNEKKRIDQLTKNLGIGEPTLLDILSNLEKPGRDPREEMPKPLFKSDVLKIEDLREGMILKGTVRNVVDFGAFVDIGLKRDGLIHVSQMGERFIKDPHKVLSVGDIISVKVLEIDLERDRIKLSLKI